MSEYNDIVGNQFDKLTVIEYLGYFVKEGTKSKRHYYQCQCNCDNKTILIVDRYKLLYGHTTSCGCNRVKYGNNNQYSKRNDYYVVNDMVFVKYSNCDEYFICDLDDWNKLKDICWHKNKSNNRN